MNLSLENKTYLIAGGSKGIGLALSQQLLAAGANVHVFSRTAPALPQNDRLVHQVCNFATDEFEAFELPDAIHGVAYCPGTIKLRSFRGLKLEDFRLSLIHI